MHNIVDPKTRLGRKVIGNVFGAVVIERCFVKELSRSVRIFENFYFKRKVILGIYYRLLFRVPRSLRTYVFCVSHSLRFGA